MKSKFVLFFTLALILILNACSPFVISSSSGEQPIPAVETLPATDLPATGYQPLDVDQVQVEVGVGSPIPVQVMVMGNLPDNCAQIELVQQKQEVSHFQITLLTNPSSGEGCTLARDTLPFRMVIPLNITNLPAGSYSVEVNGAGADFQLETGNTTSSQPAADSVIRKHNIQVDSASVEIGVGSPIPVHAIVGLSLPNSCAQLGEIRLHRESNIFYVRLIADITERADCREDSIPFRLEVPLNIVNMPEGPYEVNVNGVTASFDPNAKPAGNSDLAGFESQLQTALTQRDADAMRALMGDLSHARRLMDEGVNHATANQTIWFMALGQYNQGFIAGLAGENEYAYERMHDSLALWRELGNLRFIALALNFLSPIATQLGQLDNAQAYLQESLMICTQIHDRWGIGTAYGRLGLLALAKGDTAGAKTMLEQSLYLFTDLDARRDIAWALTQLGKAFSTSEDYGEAERLLKRAINLSLEVKIPPQAIDAALELANCFASTGKFTEAIELILSTLQHPANTDDTKRRARELKSMIEPQINTDDLEKIVLRINTETSETVLMASLTSY